MQVNMRRLIKFSSALDRRAPKRKNNGRLLAERRTRHTCVDGKGKVSRIAPALEATLKSALAETPTEKSH